MRLVWSNLVESGQQQTNEAVSRWGFSESPTTEEDTGSMGDWLFRR